MSRSNRVLPYPKRLKTLILEYQSSDDEKQKARAFRKILELIDKLLIRIIQQIYKYDSYSFLQYRDPDEIYHTAIIALEKVIVKIQPDDSFTINKLSSYLNGYVGREFKIQFSKDNRYVGFEDLGPELESSIPDRSERCSADDMLDQIRVVKPDFPFEGVQAMRMNILEDRSLDQIAKLLKVKKGQVRSWVDRGKKILKKIIEKDYPKKKEKHMSFILGEQVRLADLKVGDYISKGPGSHTYRINGIDDQVRLSKVSESLIVGFPKSVFDSEVWFKCTLSEKAIPKVIERQKVTSSNIVSVGYDPQTQTLDVEFKGGAVYRGTMVAKEIYEGFMKSDSKGNYYHNYIKGRYDIKKV